MKSVEAINAELMSAVPRQFFERHTLLALQQLTSYQADRLGRWSFPLILRAAQKHYERISWSELYKIAEDAFQCLPERVASYSSGRSSNG